MTALQKVSVEPDPTLSVLDVNDARNRRPLGLPVQPLEGRAMIRPHAVAEQEVKTLQDTQSGVDGVVVVVVIVGRLFPRQRVWVEVQRFGPAKQFDDLAPIVGVSPLRSLVVKLVLLGVWPQMA